MNTFFWKGILWLIFLKFSFEIFFSTKTLGYSPMYDVPSTYVPVFSNNKKFYVHL